VTYPGGTHLVKAADLVIIRVVITYSGKAYPTVQRASRAGCSGARLAASRATDVAFFPRPDNAFNSARASGNHLRVAVGPARHFSALKRMVAECSHDCIVGNGYAPILPMFAEHYGRRLKLIHLRRADRAACVASLRKNCELFPDAYGYYSSSP
jgi:hypothetical protein